MSLTGTPLIITAVCRWLKPRTLTRASPAPPPCAVEYTDGVMFSTSGRSREPSCAWISAFVTSVKATGVRRSSARSASTSMPPSATAVGVSAKSSIAVAPAFRLTCSVAVVKPITWTETS